MQRLNLRALRKRASKLAAYEDAERERVADQDAPASWRPTKTRSARPTPNPRAGKPRPRG